ncbi:phosphoethanolamine transferase [Mergibacter septicus]|nr:phosphoethanolamine--lipid A transferase [Mergibacter septicus]AWX14652.1 phosphoethanolamine transferase [Mergibacter septicus]
MRKTKWCLSSTTLIALVSLYFTLILNYPLYKVILKVHPFTGSAEDYFLFTIPLFIFFTLNAVFQLFALPWLHKIIMPLLLIISASIGYSELFLHVYFNTDMLENVLQTNMAESVRLLSIPYIAWIILLGIVPAILYITVKVDYRLWWKEILTRIVMILLSFLVIFGIAKFFYQDYAAFIRNNKSITHLILPSNFIASGVNAVKRIHEANRPFVQLGLDAQLVKSSKERKVIILVVGETTRAENWGLNGYQRQTTPLLSKQSNVVNFKHTMSCGTATAISVPCMFSHLDRVDYDASIARNTDNVLDILKRVGYEVVWFENDGGCKGVCNRVESYEMTQLNLSQYCKDGECLDQILLQDFDKTLLRSNRDIVVVLHTIGNHGPTYYERYTPEFRQFTPTCDTNQINRCTNQELVNTYDNGVLYIDYFLNQTIENLKVLSDKYHWDTALYYLSDHGESLGENGVYLHGTPYAIAPSQQTHIPMIMWYSDNWLQNQKLNLTCLQQQGQNNAYSQDNFFHTVLGMAEVATTVYHKNADITASCKVQ